MPYIGRIPPKKVHTCKTPIWTSYFKREGTLWQCSKCDLIWTLTAVPGYARHCGGPLYDLVWRTS